MIKIIAHQNSSIANDSKQLSICGQRTDVENELAKA